MNKKIKKTKKTMKKTLETKLYQRYIRDQKYVLEAESLEEANAKFEELEQKLADFGNNYNN